MIKGINYDRHRFLGIVVMTVAVFAVTIDFSKPYSINAKSSHMHLHGSELSSLEMANAWINSQPLASSDLKGKVVLVEFGTYTCINWIRTLPYVRAWSQKYKDKGLVVIIVHTPEFLFEKNIDNVRQAISDRKIGFPIAVDNKQDIWNAFNNQYWPALYFIDHKGRVRHHQFGEGGYEESERMIQKLLSETSINNIDNSLVSVNASGVEALADWGNLNSPENYLGYERTENFSASDLVYGKPHVYTLSTRLRLNQWGLSGDWTVEKQVISLNTSKGKIMYRFHARDLHLVMGPAISGSVIGFRVLIDGKPPGDAHGVDVDEQGHGTLDQQRMYQLIRQPNPIVDRNFEIEFFAPGVEAFSFTFG